MRRALLLALALVATACGGPTTPINATLREFPQKVRLKAAAVEDVPIAPLPPSAPRLTGGLSPLPPAPAPPPGAAEVTTTTAPPPPVGCPKAGPEKTALFAAGTEVKAAPKPATYRYRTSGKHVDGGSQASTVDYPLTATRVVSAPTPEAGATGGIAGFSYEVLVVLGENRTVTTYRVVPAGASPAQDALSPGLYISAMRTQDATGNVLSRFQPAPAMLLLPFPADQGAAFNVASTDTRSGTTMAYAGTVGDHVRVDACGEVIDTRSVTLSGRIAGRSCGTSTCGPKGGGDTTNPAEFFASYAIATQYGGMAMQDEIAVKGLGLGTPFTDELRGTISSVPLGGV